MILIITHLIVGIAGFLLAKFFHSDKNYSKGIEYGAFEKEKSIFHIHASEKENLNSEIMNNKLEINYIKGFDAGKLEERKKLSISLTPKMEIRDNFWKRTAKSGYELQVIYDGFPIGNPQYKDTEIYEKFKDENLKYAIDKANETVTTIAKHFIDKNVEVAKLVLTQDKVKGIELVKKK